MSYHRRIDCTAPDPRACDNFCLGQCIAVPWTKCEYRKPERLGSYFANEGREVISKIDLDPTSRVFKAKYAV